MDFKSIKFYLIASILVISCATPKKSSFSAKTKTLDQKVDSLLNIMTLNEKIGQLNLPTSGDITTGQASSSDVAKNIKEGKVGGLFNIKTAEKIREVQKIAVEQDLGQQKQIKTQGKRLKKRR